MAPLQRATGGVTKQRRCYRWGLSDTVNRLDRRTNKENACTYL